MTKIKDTDKICFNCSHILWLIGREKGLKCGLDTLKKSKKEIQVVPNKFHTCNSFENRK